MVGGVLSGSGDGDLEESEELCPITRRVLLGEERTGEL